MLSGRFGICAAPPFSSARSYYPGTKETRVGQAFQPDFEPYQAGKSDLLPCRGNIDWSAQSQPLCLGQGRTNAHENGVTGGQRKHFGPSLRRPPSLRASVLDAHKIPGGLDTSSQRQVRE